MPVQYAPLPNPQHHPLADDELEAAFDDSDDELDDIDSHPTTTRSGGYQSLPNVDPLASSNLSSPHDLHQPSATQHTPGTYDFESIDYDYVRPPPGSPPGPSSTALPNEYGNTNGYVPTFQSTSTDTQRARGGGWFRRAAAGILPSHYLPRLGLAPQVPAGAVGGGTSNDGVFANVTAKPTAPVRVTEGDETFIVPEESQKDAPPSYATAQLDAVPPYWETTIHAPSSSNAPGEMMIDGLPTGSLFSFMWNMLVSVSFTFIGFLLTYLLHTTHAAKLGSRAGLGVTLIQYGFAMRSRADDWIDNQTNGSSEQWGAYPPRPTFETAAEAEEWFRNNNNTLPMNPVIDTSTPENSAFMLGDVTSEWLSFFLMTVGWFILLTSLLGFWRVKRWERSILSTQQNNPPTTPAEDQARNTALLNRLERTFGLRGFRNGGFIRTGLGFPGSSAREVEPDERVAEARGEYILPFDPEDAGRNGQIARAFADEVRLQRDLRAAGLL